MKTKSVERGDYFKILELLEAYYDGLYRLDVAQLKTVFSPSATYATMANGVVLQLSTDDYFTLLTARTAPASEGVPFGYRVVSISVVGNDTALAILQCSLFGHDYTDLLSLLRIDGRWHIQAKVFEGAPTAAKEA